MTSCKCAEGFTGKTCSGSGVAGATIIIAVGVSLLLLIAVLATVAFLVYRKKIQEAVEAERERFLAEQERLEEEEAGLFSFIGL